MKRLIDGIYTWSVFNDAKQLDFNGHYLTDGQTSLLVDPPALSNEDAAQIEELGKPACILITNKDHRREAPAASARFDAPIWIHAGDESLIDCEVAATFSGGQEIDFLTVIHIPHAKSPGECALYWRDRRILVLGDALIGRTPGQLELLPDEKLPDPEKAKTGLHALENLEIDVVLVGDGTSILSEGRAAIDRALR